MTEHEHQDDASTDRTASEPGSAAPEPPPPRRRRAFLPYWLLAFLFEALAFFVVMNLAGMHGMVQTFVGLSLHLAAALVVTEGWARPWDPDLATDRNWALLGFLLVLSFFVVGILGYALLYRSARRTTDRHALLDEFKRFTEVEIEEVEQTIDPASFRDRVSRDLQVTSLRDVLQAGTPAERRGALRSLRRLEPGAAVPLLREALRDPDRQIRYLAASELNKTDRLFSQRILDRRRRLERWLNPGQATGSPSTEDLNELEALTGDYLEYVESGLPDESTRRYFIRQGVEVLEALHTHVAESRKHTILSAKLFHLGGDHDRVVEVLRHHLDRNPDDAEAMLLLARTFYDQGEIGSTIDLLRQVDPAAVDEPWAQKVIEFWGTPEALASGERA